MINTHPIAAPVTVWYGGTFDPPHRGHQEIVHRLTTWPGIEQVVVTPAYLNPFKHATLASAEQRLGWVHRIFDAPNVTIDTGEIEAGERVYTIDTLNRLKPHFDIQYIAIGADNLERIEDWHAFDQLNRQYTWLVFDRKEGANGYEMLRDYQRIPLDIPVSSSHIRANNAIDDVDPRIANDVQKLLTKGTQ